MFSTQVEPRVIKSIPRPPLQAELQRQIGWPVARLVAGPVDVRPLVALEGDPVEHVRLGRAAAAGVDVIMVTIFDFCPIFGDFDQFSTKKLAFFSNLDVMI
jgi:hypothetical protein